MAVTTQVVLGTGTLVLAMQAVWTLFGPVLPPIIVNSLTYEAGYIVQDRQITTTGPFTAFWDAAILDAQTGAAVPNCTGSGVWDYPPGQSAPRFPVTEWVGNPKCDLPPGSYIPTATYSAGEFRVVARGEPFEVME